MTKTNGHNGNGNGNGNGAPNGRWSAQVHTVVLIAGLLVSAASNYALLAAKTGEDERRIVKLEEEIVPRSEHVVWQQQEDKILLQMGESIIRIEDKLDHIGQQVTAQQAAQSYSNNSKR